MAGTDRSGIRRHIKSDINAGRRNKRAPRLAWEVGGMLE